MFYPVRLLLALVAAIGFASSAPAQESDTGATLTVGVSSLSLGSLTFANTYRGVTTVVAGTLHVGNTGALGSGTTVVTDGSVTVSGGILTVVGSTNDVTLGSTTFTNSGTLTFDLGMQPVATPGAGTLSLNSPYLYSGGTISLVAPAGGLTLSSGTSILYLTGPAIFSVGNALTIEAAPEPESILLALMAVPVFIVLGRRAHLGDR